MVQAIHFLFISLHKKFMSIKPYSDSDNKKSQVSRMFDNIAGKYDFLNHFLSLHIDTYWRYNAIKILSNLSIEKKPVILDVATGTGDLALACLKLQPEKIVGIDISEKMLEYGRVKINKKKQQHIISLQTGDSENMTFPDHSFDIITVAFGVRNFENLQKGLIEMFRVLKPNGKVLILEFSKPHFFPLKQLYLFYFKSILPFLGKTLSKDAEAYTYLPASVLQFPQDEEFINILISCGFQPIQQKKYSGGICSAYFCTK